MTLKVGVIGVGAWGKNHVRVYSELPNAELIFIADINESKAKEVSKRFKVPYSTNYQDALKHDVDAVSICVPTSAHYEITKFFINSGVHVLLEKPLTADYELAKDLVHQAKKSNVRLMAGLIERFNPAVTYTKRLIKEGNIGEILALYGERVSPRPLRIMDVSVLYDLGIHEVDIVRYILNRKVIKVYGVLKRFKAYYHDFAQLFLDIEDNITAYVSTNWLTPRKIRLLRVLGTNGLIIVNYITQEVTVEYEKESLKPVITYQEPLKIELDHFISSIIKKEKFMSEGEDALETLKILKFIEKSAKMKRSLEIQRA